MSWWSIIAAAVVAIGVVSYTIYESYMREEQHSYRRSKKDNRSESRTYEDIERYEDINARNEELRRRNISKKEIENEKESVKKKKVPVFDHSTQRNISKTEIQNEKQSVKKKEVFDQSTQAVDSDHPEFTLSNNGNCILNNDDISFVSSVTAPTVDGTESICDSNGNSKNEKQSVKNKEVPVFDCSTQTVDSDRPEFTLPNNGNCILNIDDISSVSSFTTVDGTESTCDSIASIETITSNMDQDLLADSIPTWSEMSSADRNLSLCRNCQDYVSTVTIPCEHPYLCETCAPILIKHYSKCLHCSEHISDYQSVENL